MQKDFGSILVAVLALIRSYLATMACDSQYKTTSLSNLND
jgi:hypothetical protein